MSKFVDAFLFNGEYEVLEIRLAELFDAVDFFVIAESDLTFTGLPKPLYFEEAKERFRKYASKIIYLPIKNTRADKNPWANESYQRNCIMEALRSFDAEDHVGIGDVDEIPRSECLKRVISEKPEYFGMRMRLFWYRLNYLNISGPDSHDLWYVGAKIKNVKSAQKLRERRRFLLKSRLDNRLLLPDAGWHYSFLGQDDFVKRKLESYSHQEFNLEHPIHIKSIEDIIKSRIGGYLGKDLWAVIPREIGPHPRLVSENMERYSLLFADAEQKDLELVLKVLYTEGKASFSTRYQLLNRLRKPPKWLRKLIGGLVKKG
jgi:beta-1,4-mannosyl-glycoprotein beta-1,4-N-acetylglucosaminyltransferase